MSKRFLILLIVTLGIGGLLIYLIQSAPEKIKTQNKSNYAETKSSDLQKNVPITKTRFRKKPFNVTIADADQEYETSDKEEMTKEETEQLNETLEVVKLTNELRQVKLTQPVMKSAATKPVNSIYKPVSSQPKIITKKTE